jgi:WD40 repeat protein
LLAVASNGGWPDLEAGQVSLWDISGTPRLERTLPLNVDHPGINKVTFVGNGELIGVTGNTDPKTGAFLGGDVIGWKTATGSFAFPPIVLPHVLVHHIAVNAAGTLAAVGVTSPTQDSLRVLRLPSGAQVGAPTPIPIGIQGLSLAEATGGSGTSLLVGDYAGRVQHRSWPSLRLIGRPVLAGGGPLSAVASVPGAAEYFSADYDGTTRLWDLASNTQIGSSFTPLQAVFLGMSISADGHWLALLGDNGTAWTFPLSERLWEQLACRAASRNLTVTEWRQFVGPSQPYGKVCAQYPLPRS